MKFLRLIGCVFSCWASFAQVGNYEIGDIVDDFTVTDTNGVVFNLYDTTSSGSYVFLDFFFDTCPPCQLTQATWNEFYDKYGCNEGAIKMISINNGTDTNAEVITFQEEYGGTFNHSPAVGIEGGCALVDENFGVVGYPAYVLISPENEFLYIIAQIPQTVSNFEEAFPIEFNPAALECSLGITLHSLGNVVVYPNPVIDDYFRIIFSESVTDSQIVIYDFSGKIVYSGSFKSNLIEIKNQFQTGIYFFSAKTNKGNFHKKIIVK